MPDPSRPAGPRPTVQKTTGGPKTARGLGRPPARPQTGRPSRPEAGSSLPGQGPGGSRRPRFAPRDPRRARYYKASLVAAGVFVALALALPLWIDHVRRTRDRESFDSLRSWSPAATPSPAAPAREDRTPGANLPYSPESGHATCQAYATARCNALGIPPGPCGEVSVAALAVPTTASLAECRKVVEPKLAEAARLHGTLVESATPVEAAPTGPPPVAAPIGAPPSPAALDATPTPPPPGPPGPEATDATPPSQRPSLSATERADNLARIHVLVEELQRGAQNYATPPAAQAARFDELRRRVEADGSEDLRSLYNTLLLQAGRTAGVEMPRPGLRADETPMAPAAPGEERARTTTPEMDRVRGMLDEARRQAGQAPGPPPALGPTFPPTSVDPSAVQAPPARSL